MHGKGGGGAVSYTHLPWNAGTLRRRETHRGRCSYPKQSTSSCLLYTSRLNLELLLETYRSEARRLWEETDYVVVAEHPVYGVFELACWMCGFEDILWRLAADRPFVHKLFGKLLALQKEFIRPYYQAVGEFAHLTTSGDDFGTQTGPFMAPKAFRELVLPYFAERIAYTREFTAAHYWHHRCV